MENINMDLKRDLYFKAHNVIKHEKIRKYLTEKEIISHEGVSFWGGITGQNNLQYERLRNVKLRIELAQAEKAPEKTNYEIIDTLVDMNKCALSEFSGQLVGEIKSLYENIKNNYCDESITDEKINLLTNERVQKEESFLPVIHEQKVKGVFGSRRSQIAFYRIENKKLEELIVSQRGKMQFETFSSDLYQKIIPQAKTVKK